METGGEGARPTMRVVIRCPNWVGDAVMATPALRSLRRGFQESRICLVGKRSIIHLLHGLPYFDDTLFLGGKGTGAVLALAGALRKRKHDLGVLFPNSFSSALSFFLGGVKERCGYDLNGRRWLLTRSIRPEMEGLKRRPSPMTEYYLELARFVGGGETDDRMELRTDPVLDEEAERFFRSHGLKGVAPLVGLNPGASFGPSKQWTPEGFAEVADRVARDLGGRCLLLCGPGEESIAEAIRARAVQPLVDTSRSVLPLDLLKSVVARLDALVTTDTGPRHFAAALSVPSVVIMGPTDPRYTAAAVAWIRSFPGLPGHGLNAWPRTPQ